MQQLIYLTTDNEVKSDDIDNKKTSNLIKQSTNNVLMIPPTKYSTFNEETAKDNKFMHHDKNVTSEIIYNEWDSLKKELIKNGINVITPKNNNYDANTPGMCHFIHSIYRIFFRWL